MSVATKRARKDLRPTFKQWLVSQVNRDGPIGDLAYEALDDASWPEAPETFDRVLLHLSVVRADPIVKAVARVAWHEYRQYVRT